jgi:hypothetical protein
LERQPHPRDLRGQVRLRCRLGRPIHLDATQNDTVVPIIVERAHPSRGLQLPRRPKHGLRQFGRADANLWDSATGPGDEGILWVQAQEVEASVSQRPRTKKRPRQDAGDDSDKDESMQVELQCRRRKA